VTMRTIEFPEIYEYLRCGVRPSIVCLVSERLYLRLVGLFGYVFPHISYRQCSFNCKLFNVITKFKSTIKADCQVKGSDDGVQRSESLALWTCPFIRNSKC
jgi:hypothetical protein